VEFVAEKVEVSQVFVRLFRFYFVKFYSVMFHVLSPTTLGLNMVNISGSQPHRYTGWLHRKRAK